jgi:dihydropteroate synthase
MHLTHMTHLTSLTHLTFFLSYLRFKNNEQRLMFTLNCKGRLLVVDKPLVMGILNITPDSFYSGSRVGSTEMAVEKAGRMLKEGATIIDIGGQSTRPGSERISETEELQRVIPVVEAIHREFPEAFISIDTFYAGVARAAVQAGASLVNDISAGSLDEQMIPVAASLQVPYVLMHMQGTPQTMQQEPRYENVTREVLDFFISKMEFLRRAGIKDIIADPGFGFGKSLTNNFALLRQLPVFQIMNRPILVGVSRKSMVYKALGISSVDALNGTTVLHTIALMNGASLLRVHDVKEAVEAVRLYVQYSEGL